jgi:hypothetical protein
MISQEECHKSQAGKPVPADPLQPDIQSVRIDKQEILHIQAPQQTSSMCRAVLQGVPCVQAVGEGEAMCAALNVCGWAHAVQTADADALLFGALTVYKHMQLQVGVSVTGTTPPASVTSGVHVALDERLDNDMQLLTCCCS